MPDAETIARVAWEANRQLQIADGETLFDDPWDCAPEWRKQLCVQTVQGVIDGGLNDPQDTHEHWMAVMHREGWAWGADKDPWALLHPSLVPWEELTPRGQLAQKFLVMITRMMIDAEARMC